MQSEWAARSHQICSEAAQQTVQMLRSLDKFGLLEQISSDAIHILSLATLFDGSYILHHLCRHEAYGT